VEDKKDKMSCRVFMSKAFLKKIDSEHFGLFRNIETEDFDRQKGRPVRERAGEVGPIGVFREMRDDEKDEPDLVSFHPVDRRPMRLRKVS
jgi:hypothetical protein